MSLLPLPVDQGSHSGRKNLGKCFNLTIRYCPRDARNNKISFLLRLMASYLKYGKNLMPVFQCFSVNYTFTNWHHLKLCKLCNCIRKASQNMYQNLVVIYDCISGKIKVFYNIGPGWRFSGQCLILQLRHFENLSYLSLQLFEKNANKTEKRLRWHISKNVLQYWCKQSLPSTIRPTFVFWSETIFNNFQRRSNHFLSVNRKNRQMSIKLAQK